MFREPDPDQPFVRTASGRAVPTIALERWLSWRAGELNSWLQRPDRWRSPCTDPAERLGKAESRAVLEKLALTRLREQIPSPLSSPEDHRYGSLLASAAAPHVRALYRSIASSLPWGQLRARLLTHDEAGRPAAAHTALIERLQAHDLRPHGHQSVRPNARPERRLAGIAHLLARYSVSGLSDPLSRAGARSTPALLDALSVGPAEQGDSALIGRGGAIELATNAVTPSSSPTPCGRATMKLRAFSLTATSPFPGLPATGEQLN